MFARALTQSGVRASLRMPQSSLRALHTAPRARLAVTMPATQRMLAQRHMSAMAKKDLGDVHEGNDVRRGFDEVVPFLKRELEKITLAKKTNRKLTLQVSPSMCSPSLRSCRLSSSLASSSPPRTS